MEPVYWSVDRSHICFGPGPYNLFSLGLSPGPGTGSISESFFLRGLDPRLVTIKFYSLVAHVYF